MSDKWTWQETLVYSGTEAECKAAFAEFSKKKNGAHFVMGKEGPPPVHTPAALKKGKKK